MSDDRSNYAGLAAVAVLLIGLLLIANTALQRIAVLGVIIFAVALAFSPTGSRQLLCCAIAAVVCSGWIAYIACSSQLTGKATYFNGKGRWGMNTEIVTREEAPTKFHQAVKTTWTGSLGLACIGAGCFGLHRRLEKADYF